MDPRPHYKALDYRASGKLEGKVALITGGDSGIGRAVALLFAREGADVAITYLPEEQEDADETIEVLEDTGRRALALVLDVRDPEACSAIVQRVKDELGRLDILVNNAAYQQHRGSLEELSIDQWRRTFETNIYGYFYMCKAALPLLEPGAVIINTGSETGLEGNEGLLDYSATKGAIHAYTKALAQNLVPKGIRVNCVAPGPVWTPLNPAERDDEDMQSFGAKVPYGRPAQPDEIAPAYVYFASNADSGYVTGEVLKLLGGTTMAA